MVSYSCNILLLELTLLFYVSAGPVEIPPVGIGIICDRSSCTPLEPSAHTTSHNVTLEWSLINTREIFQVMKSVQTFDQQDNISSIMMLEYNQAMLDLPHLLRTKKPLLYWGSRHVQHGQIPLTKPHNTSSICPKRVQEKTNAINSMYCKPHDDTSNGQTSVFKLADLVLQLMVHLRWKHVVILHDNATQTRQDSSEPGTRVGRGPDKEAYQSLFHALFQEPVARVIDKLSTSGIMSLIYNIDVLGDLNGTLNDIYRKDVTLERSTKFLTLCRFAYTRSILQTASVFADQKGTTLFAQFSRWLSILIDGDQDMQQSLCMSATGLDNFATIVLPKSKTATVKDFLQILDVTLLDIFRNSSGTQDNQSYPESLIASLIKKSRELDSTYICGRYYIDTLLWSKEGRVFNTVGSVNGHHISVTSEIFPNTKYGYNKKEFIVSTLPYAPFVMKTMVDGKPEYSGLSIDLLRELSVNLNFTYRIIEPEDQKWGSYFSKEDKTFNGLIGQLQRKECDFVFTVISIQKERTHACDFSYPYFYQFTTVAIKRADIQQNKWRTLIDPFHWLVHIAIGVAFLLTTCIIFVFERYNPYYIFHEKRTGSEETDRLNHLHNAFWYMFGALLSQGGVHLPKSVAGRTFISCWGLFSLVIVGTYSGNLVASLTVTKETLPFNTLKEMAAMGDSYRWGTLGGSFWEVVFTTSTTPLYKEIGDKMVKFNRSDPDIFHQNPDFHVQRVKQGGYAWIGDKTYIERVTATDCELVRIKEEVFPWLIAVGLVKNSPHTRIFDAAIMKIHESGLLELWKRKWWPKSNICKKATLPEAKPISLTDVQSAFYVCCAGVIISATALGLELFVFYMRTRNKPNDRPVIHDNQQLDTSL